MEVECFVSKFHSLAGPSLGAKRKSLFLLLQHTPEDHDALISALIPRNYVENCFKLEILLRLERIPELIEVLKNEEEHLPAKLLRSKRFCQQLSSILDENSADFVEGVLPFTSFVIRGRLFSKLAVYGTKLDPLYDEICGRYGAKAAANLLVGCSVDKIEDVLKKKNVAIAPYFQRILYQKHPQLVDSLGIHESVLRYIASNNIEAFLRIIEKSKLLPNLGKRVTRKLLTNHRELIFADSKKYARVLHLRTLTRVLKEPELKQFFFNCFPPSIENLRGFSIVNNLRAKLGKRSYEFLSEGVRKVYNKNLYDFPDLVDESMLASMDEEERQKWITIKKSEDLIKFMRIGDSIPLLKNKINVTSAVHGREKLLRSMVESCKVNNDLSALADVCEYVCFRHRNDDEFVLRNFLVSVSNSFKLGRLEGRHWQSLLTIISIINAQNNQTFYMYDFYLEHTEFLFREKKLTEEKIHEFLKFVRNDYRWNYNTKSKELNKLLLLKTIELMPKLIKSDDKLHHKDLRLIDFIFRWNRDNPQDDIPIVDHPRLTQSFRKSVDDVVNDVEYVYELAYLKSIFQTIICTNEKTEFRDDTIKKYFLLGFRYTQTSIDFWLLKYQPEVVFSNFEVFLTHVLHDYKSNWDLLNYLKKYSDLTLQQKTVNFCLQQIEKHEYTDKAFLILAVLTPDTFLQTTRLYDPSQIDKIDFNDGESKRQGQLINSVAKSFKYASGTLVLPTLIKYCKGDFLRHALESLYYRFYHSPESHLSRFIDELSSKAVSVRKHSIFLTCSVGTVSQVQKLLSRFLENERNVSVQKHLFTAALKYFVKNPSDDLWETVKMCMKNLDKNDSESFDMLVNLHQIPQDYKARHVVFVWGMLKENQDLDEHRPRLISSIPPSVFRDLPREFLEGVISENFLQIGSSCASAVNSFIVSALAYSDYKYEILVIIFAVMSQTKNRMYDTLKEEKNDRQILASFVSDLARNLRTSQENREILRAFSARWHSVFPVVAFMREHLQLSFNLLYLDADKDLQKFSRATAETLEQLVSTYGVVIVDCFSSELSDFLNTILYFHSDGDERYFQFCLDLLQNRNGLIYYLLVIKLLPSKEPSRDGPKELFLQIVHILRHSPLDSIQMLMNLYIVDMK